MSQYNQEYLMSHLERRYLNRILDFEQALLKEGLNLDSNISVS